MAKKKAQPLTEAEKAYARTTTRLQVAAAVWALWERVRDMEDLDQQWLADRLGKDKGRVSRLLREPGNWTMDTVADLLEAMGGRVTKVETMLYSELARRPALSNEREGNDPADFTGISREIRLVDVKISNLILSTLEGSVNDNDWEDSDPYLALSTQTGARRAYERVSG